MSLAAIAESTKIKLSLLDSLERGDVSQWPRGLFRRAYLRDYASAIGLPAEPLVAEFVRLFPEDGTPVDEVMLEAPEPMRLTFPAGSALTSQRVICGARGAAMELGLVVAAGVGLTFLTGLPVLTACGWAALVYYPVATALTGRTLSVTRLRWLAGRAAARGPVETASEAPPLYLVPRAAAPLGQASAPLGDDVAAPHTAAG